MQLLTSRMEALSGISSGRAGGALASALQHINTEVVIMQLSRVKASIERVILVRNLFFLFWCGKSHFQATGGKLFLDMVNGKWTATNNVML